MIMAWLNDERGGGFLSMKFGQVLQRALLKTFPGAAELSRETHRTKGDDPVNTFDLLAHKSEGVCSETTPSVYINRTSLVVWLVQESRRRWGLVEMLCKAGRDEIHRAWKRTTSSMVGIEEQGHSQPEFLLQTESS